MPGYYFIAHSLMERITLENEYSICKLSLA